VRLAPLTRRPAAPHNVHVTARWPGWALVFAAWLAWLATPVIGAVAEHQNSPTRTGAPSVMMTRKPISRLPRNKPPWLLQLCAAVHATSTECHWEAICRPVISSRTANAARMPVPDGPGVPAPVQVRADADVVVGGEPPVERDLLSQEADPGQEGRVLAWRAAEHRHLARGRLGQPGQQAQ